MNAEVIRKILAYIDEHIHEKIYLRDLAELAGYSPFYFSKLFSESLGIPVTGYIRMRKLQYVLASLLEGKNVLEVSLLYAFDSASLEEAKKGFCTEIDVTVFQDGRVKIADNGRGIPLSKDEKQNQQVLNKILAGHPLSNMEYARLGDLPLSSLRTVNSLCESLQVKVHRNGTCFTQDYVRGIAQHDVICSASETASGMEMLLKPDTMIFGDLKLYIHVIRKWADEISKQNGNAENTINIHITEESEFLE